MSQAAPYPRREPLLWLQLLGLGVMPLEALLLLLLLAGSDPGPLPALERLLCWAIGSLAPTLLLWNRPADVWSLLLVQAPLRGRRTVQHQLSALQGTPLLQAGLLLGCGLSLALLIWTDGHAALASSFSPLEGGPRLVALLLAAAVLSLLLWQWQQLLQAFWLLSRAPATVAATAPMAQANVIAKRLGLGIPLLLLDPLDLPTPEVLQPRPTRPAQGTSRPDPGPAPQTAAAGEQQLQSEPESSSDEAADSPPDSAGSSAADPDPSPTPTPTADPIAAPGPQPAAEAPSDPPTTPAAALDPLEASEPPSTELTPQSGPDPDGMAAGQTPEPRSGAGAAVAVDPEQAAADEQSRGLDQQVG